MATGTASSNSRTDSRSTVARRTPSSTSATTSRGTQGSTYRSRRRRTTRRTPRRAEPEPEPAPVPYAPPKPAARDRYFDTLRAVALVRVVTYHTFGWAWAGMVFPSMGIMFALAGTLMAKSLERPALKVIRSRIRRLLPPFWFWGFFVVVAMLIHDWMPGWQIVYWIVPLGDPPGNAWGEQAWEILWYLRTYLWFVLLSPLLLRVFRLAPVTVLAPLPRPDPGRPLPVGAAGRPLRQRAHRPGHLPLLLDPRLRAPRRRPAAAEAVRRRRPLARRDRLRRLVRLHAPGRDGLVRPRRHPARAGLLVGGVRDAPDVREGALPDRLRRAWPASGASTGS